MCTFLRVIEACSIVYMYKAVSGRDSNLTVNYFEHE